MTMMPDSPGGPELDHALVEQVARLLVSDHSRSRGLEDKVWRVNVPDATKVVDFFHDRERLVFLKGRREQWERDHPQPGWRALLFCLGLMAIVVASVGLIAWTGLDDWFFGLLE